MPEATPGPQRRRFLAASILIGIGLGSVFEGIVLHQILQWHHMVSAQVPPDTLAGLEVNTIGDGLFHALTWIVLLNLHHVRPGPGEILYVIGFLVWAVAMIAIGAYLWRGRTGARPVDWLVQQG